MAWRLKLWHPFFILLRRFRIDTRQQENSYPLLGIGDLLNLQIAKEIPSPFRKATVTPNQDANEIYYTHCKY